ncbi:hypothetical protein Q3G72_030748 [Acer saccharum]|nr:hypothetical protein Q3G72_030748 [Acer saccharum]
MVRWIPPPPWVFKINSDAAMDVKLGKVGVGIIIRNVRGDVLSSSPQPISAGFGVQIAECVALLRGLQLGVSLGLVPCIVESDALTVVNLVNSNQPPPAEIGIAIQDVILLLRSNSNCIESELLCGVCVQRG